MTAARASGSVRDHGLVALVRPPTAALARCELTFRGRERINVDLAARQHGGYVEALRRLGVTVGGLAPEPGLPDAPFVEDTAVVLDEVAVIARPGAEVRRAEVPSVAQALAEHRPRAELSGPGTLDGGDVLRVDRVLFVGRSTRTDVAGINELRERVVPFGYEVRPVAVRRCLHLKSACSYVGDDTVLIARAHVDPGPFAGLQLLDAPPHEPFGANTLRVGETILMADGFPATRELLERHGLDVRTVDVSEFRKAEAGVSCLSIIFAVSSH